jgi:hypothetical protein
MKGERMPGSNNEHEPTLARLRTADIAMQFDGSLDASEQEQVARRVERMLDVIEELRAYPLENADEPAPVFRPIGKEQP